MSDYYSLEGYAKYHNLQAVTAASAASTTSNCEQNSSTAVGAQGSVRSQAEFVPIGGEAQYDDSIYEMFSEEMINQWTIEDQQMLEDHSLYADTFQDFAAVP